MVLNNRKFWFIFLLDLSGNETPEADDSVLPNSCCDLTNVVITSECPTATVPVFGKRLSFAGQAYFKLSVLKL